MKKVTLFISFMLLPVIGMTTWAKPKQSKEKKSLHSKKTENSTLSYGLVKFRQLPHPQRLKSAGVVSLNYVSEGTIYGHVKDYEELSKLPEFLSFETLSPELKICETLKEKYLYEKEGQFTAFIYLPSDFSQVEISAFCSDNGITHIECSSLPHYVLMSELSAEKIVEITQLETVSWVSEAPDYAREGHPFHLCPGGATEYGPWAEFASFVTVPPGWDGEGLGCADLTYFFENGTPDISGIQEQGEVIRALRTWEKYVQVNFTRTNTANELDGLDISWESGAHGDGSPFDGPGRVLAHAFYPNPPNPETIAGDVHFDEAETWSLSGGTHLYSVALHEIGHSLGMDHSSDPDAVMFASYSSGTEFPDLHTDDIAGIRTLYRSRTVNANEWDKTFVGNVTGSSHKEIVMVNTSYNGGAIRVDNMITGENLLWINHCSFQGWMDNSDKMFLGDANGDGHDDLILVNTGYSGGAIRAIDLTTGANLSWIVHGSYGGWMDATDKMFVANVNGTPQDELILVNTSYTGGAVRSVNLLTGATVSQLNHTGGTFNGWMDATDRMLMGDANGDNEEDLILINTSYSGGAIRSLDVTSGINWGWLSHSGTFNGWMDANDKVAVANMNNDNKDELILVNTSYSGGAIRSLNLQTGTNYSWLVHGSYGGWMDYCDRLFIADVNNDNEEDLVLVNTSYSGGAIRGVDISSGFNLSWLVHGSYGGWMDGADRMFCEDVNSDGRSEVIMINTGYSGGAIRPTTVATGAHLSWLTHTGTFNGWMDGFSVDQNCYSSPVFKSINGHAGEADESLNTISQNLTPFRIYPNPANEFVQIELTNLNMNEAKGQIYNMQGELVLNEITLISGVNKVDVDILNSGTYLVKLTDGDRVIQQKIQIIR